MDFKVFKVASGGRGRHTNFEHVELGRVSTNFKVFKVASAGRAGTPTLKTLKLVGASWRPTSPSPPLANPAPQTLGKRRHRKIAEATKPSRSMQCCTRFLAEFSDRAPQRRGYYCVNPQRARQRPEPSHNVCEPLRPLLFRYGVTLAGEEREHTNSPTARANPAPGSGSNTARPDPFRDNPPRQ